MPKIIAVLGMPGSGKTEAVKYLEEKYGWPKVYFGQITLDEVKRLGLPVTAENERIAREGLRDRFGEDYYVKEIIKKIEDLGDVQFILLESMYSWVEYQVLKKRFGNDFIAINIHSNPNLRYSRLASRPIRPITEAEAIKRDVAQLERLEQGSPIALADFVFLNEGVIQDMYLQLDNIVEKIRKI